MIFPEASHILIRSRQYSKNAISNLRQSYLHHIGIRKGAHGCDMPGCQNYVVSSIACECVKTLAGVRGNDVALFQRWFTGRKIAAALIFIISLKVSKRFRALKLSEMSS